MRLKRVIGKELGLKFPKMNVVREYQDDARQLFEKNDENYLYANKCGIGLVQCTYIKRRIERHTLEGWKQVHR